jgi:DNA repair exonuclease SbcCD ATPase subunit
MQSRRILLREPAMGKTHEALKKAETEFLREFGKNNYRPETSKPGRPKRLYIGLFILGLVTLIVAGYVYGRRDGKSTAADVNALQSAQTRIAQLDKTLTIKNHKLVELEKRLLETEKNVQEGQRARESQREELSTNKAKVKTLQEQLKTAQSHQSDLRDEIASSKQLIKTLRAQLITLRKKIDSAEAAPVIVQAPKKQPEVVPSFNLQKDEETDKFDRPLDDRVPESLGETDGTTDHAKDVLTAESDPPVAKAHSPDPAKLIDWLLKKQSE